MGDLVALPPERIRASSDSSPRPVVLSAEHARLVETQLQAAHALRMRASDVSAMARLIARATGATPSSAQAAARAVKAHVLPTEPNDDST